MRSVPLLALFAILGPAAVVRPVAAQSIRGIVVDDTNLTRVPGATVRLVAGDELGAGTETDADGRFFLATPGEGEYRLEVSRFGYVTARSQPVRVPSSDTVSVEFRVAPDAILLNPITITGRSRRGRRDFERRLDGWERGVRLTPDQIDSIAPRHPADVFRAVAKVVVHWDWGELSTGGFGPVPAVRTFLGRGCMQFMVDYVLVTPEPWAATEWNGYILNTLLPEDIVAVEVYRSYNEVPPELQRYTHEFRQLWSGGAVGTTWDEDEKVNCGLTVYWTRTGW
jgi:hypothetical protein